MNIIKAGQSFENKHGEAGTIINVIDFEGEEYEELPSYSVKAIVIESIEGGYMVQYIEDAKDLEFFSERVIN